MSSGNFFSPAGLSAAATILLTLPGQVQASAENYQYQMKYSADAQSIRPTTVFDDGKATWFVRHCCKVSDEAAFCLIQRPYISKTLLT
ncbi:hypothetical protein R9M98_00290, partial [Escherichia coli]